MASFSGFIRKAPSERLRRFLEARQVNAPEDFDWTSEGRGTAFTDSIVALLAELPGLQQDKVKAELDHLASLADGTVMVSAEQVCPLMGIDLEGFEGVQDVLLMLAMDHPQAFERVAVQASLNRRTGGRNWSAFQFEDDGKPWALDCEGARGAFVGEAMEILNLPRHRKREADWYKTLRTHPITGEETEIVQATIYVEDHAASELTFGTSEGLERQVFRRVLEVGIACDPKERIVEICAKGGKKVRDEYAQAFAKHFAPQSKPPVEAPRREVLLDTLRSNPTLRTEPAEGVARVEVSALEFWVKGGGSARYERRGEEETIYQFLDRQFGNVSPLNSRDWLITGATLRLFMQPQEGKRARTFTLTLRRPNTTTIPNATDKDRQFVMQLLERWKLVAPPPESFDVIEAA